MIIERLPKYTEKETINEEIIYYCLFEFIKQIKIPLIINKIL
jgi:hypothetical protein